MRTRILTGMLTQIGRYNTRHPVLIRTPVKKKYIEGPCASIFYSFTIKQLQVQEYVGLLQDEPRQMLLVINLLEASVKIYKTLKAPLFFFFF